jgi:hypothetical protein
LSPSPFMGETNISLLRSLGRIFELGSINISPLRGFGLCGFNRMELSNSL